MFADVVSSVAIILGAIVVYLTNWYILDPLMAIGISILIIAWAWDLFKDSVNILLETAPKGMNINDINFELKRALHEIKEITDMHVWEITSNMYYFMAHVNINTSDPGKSKEILAK